MEWNDKEFRARVTIGVSWNASFGPGWDGIQPATSNSLKGNECVYTTQVHSRPCYVCKSQKCHSDSNGETAKRCSPVCVYLISKGTESRALLALV